MKKIVFLLLALSSFAAEAQIFHPAVKIEFEKVVYVRQQIKEQESEWYEMIKDRLPDQAVSYYEFIGDTSQSLYRQTREVVVPAGKWYQPMGDNNVVFNNYTTGKTITQKPVAEETFLVTDNLLNIRWKLTNDTRNIAGFDCRKAIGIVDDTLAIFAFYTDEILVTGGPESIHGLPGMVLGVGVPRLHATWFATKVQVNDVATSKIVPATKGKKVDRKQLLTQLDDVMKSWGEYGRHMIMNFVL